MSKVCVDLRESPRYRQQCEPLAPPHQAALRPQPAARPHPRRGPPAERLRLHPLPQVRPRHQSGLAPARRPAAPLASLRSPATGGASAFPAPGGPYTRQVASRPGREPLPRRRRRDILHGVSSVAVTVRRAPASPAEVGRSARAVGIAELQGPSRAAPMILIAAAFLILFVVWLVRRTLPTHPPCGAGTRAGTRRAFGRGARRSDRRSRAPSRSASRRLIRMTPATSRRGRACGATPAGRRAPEAAGAARAPPEDQGRARPRFAISSAVDAAAQPLLPALVPARSTACSMVSVVSTPKMTGTPRVEAHLGDALGDLGGDVVEVRRAAADDGAEADHGVVLAGSRRAAWRPAASRRRPAPRRSPRRRRRRRAAAGSPARLRTAACEMSSLNRPTTRANFMPLPLSLPS